MKKKVYSVCGMCTVRCPIQAEVENNEIRFLQGNVYVPAMKGGICPRGVAGTALINDNERPQEPLIREGARGEGKWRAVSWDEALDYVAGKLSEVRETYGARGIGFSDRGGPFRDYHRAFLRGLGTPNYCNHDTSCARNVQHACLSVTGMGRKGVVYDLKNSRHVVLQLRNILESINVQEVNNLLDAMDSGCKLTVIDIRANVSASKADRFFMVRPKSDYAFNLAVIHELLYEELYDKDFAAAHIKDLEVLTEFVRDYTPEWAEAETGVSPAALRSFVRELADAAPAVIWHPGWMTARYTDSFYVCRSIYIINALLGSFGAKGGLPLAAKPGDVDRKGLKSFMDLYPKPEEKRVDGAGWKYPHLESGPGLAHLMYKAMETADPYPVKAYIAYRHDPMMGFPDPDRLKQIFDHLDLLVSVTFSWSDTAWNSDVVLPLSPYLERESIVASKNGLKPQFFVRDRAVDPRFDTRADWEIISGLARRLDLPDLVFDSIDAIRNFQLQDTGVNLSDFAKKGFVALCDEPVYLPPRFKTPSGKIEIISEKLEKEGLPSLKPYDQTARPPEGQFRLTFGRCAAHTQGHTVNNPILGELVPENVLWIHPDPARKIGLNNGGRARVSRNGHTEEIKVKITDVIHPEAVFVLHGFGHQLPPETRAFGKGLADNRLMQGGLDIWDKAGGAMACQEFFVTVSRA